MSPHQSAEKDAPLRLTLSDGSSWPMPALDTPEGGLAWRLTYTEPSRADVLRAVSIINAYAYLLTETTAKRRDLIVREIRAALDNDKKRESGMLTPEQFHQRMPKTIQGMAQEEIEELATAYIHLLHMIVTNQIASHANTVTLQWAGDRFRVVGLMVVDDPALSGGHPSESSDHGVHSPPESTP